jgi:hypothetical protein
MNACAYKACFVQNIDPVLFTNRKEIEEVTLRFRAY